MGFRVPESLKGSFVGVGSELARSSLGVGHSSSFPVEEVFDSSGMGFRATESLKSSFVGVGSELVRSSLGLGLPFPSRGRSLRFLRDGVQSTRVTEV